MARVIPPTSGSGPAINQIIIVAQQNFGVPYSENAAVRNGPTAFDCSGYVHYCYLQGGGVDIGDDTAAQMQSPQGAQVIPSNGKFISYADLQPGDLVFWGNSIADLGSQHVEMFVGDTLGDLIISGVPVSNASSTPLMVGAYHSGTVSGPSILNLNGDGSIAGDGVANFLMLMRYQQSLPGGTAGNNPAVTTANGAGTTSNVTQNPALPNTSLSADLADPRNNLPFSSYFLARNTNFASFKGVTPLYAERHLVRGGIGQVDNVQGLPKRPGGPFVCYFMMNPQTISTDYSIDTSSVVPPNTQTAASNSIPNLSSAGLTQGSTVSFQIIFNRMYEVWRGDSVIKGSGPSVIGCRWDTRALERLIGMYDNIDTANPVGTNGAASPYPVPQLVQVVFGTNNSIIYNGYISSLNYEYTMFSVDMVPIECYVNISIWMVYQPSGQDIINSVQNVPSDYFTPAGSGKSVVTQGGAPLAGFLGS